MERGATKGQRIICKSIDGQKRIINPTKDELDSNPRQFHAIQVKGRQIPVSKKKMDQKQDDYTLCQHDMEQLKSGRGRHGNKYQELMQGKLRHWSTSQESGRQSEEEGREIMVRD